ncbi:hypothetical protein MKP08_06655 [Erythrobacter sp. LQ02-29]|uniref:hypothetical protein n=1 Tax=unclassified Erythrobacter TaxID=2633097 RepID=UPI001BFC762E|nr:MULTISPECIES: hypothetical protein [unclassified Erythrobacter]MCP9222424.1 hypothetical protein [Erythrobacter sp. LQ02-29]QWC56279.1 hypothetical protein F7D01_03525 [Erythrobacter sp. 3-20A1M]
MAQTNELAAKLLRDAGQFFRHVGEQNPELKEQMDNNAQVYDQVAGMVETDPTGDLPVADEEGQQQVN